MKAKRIVSILLTGSMLLSLLPVSALAATPVFDAPAQTTAKKAAPLVQEADASRSTEEEAATRSSRDLDAENGTAESITTIQLNAAGKPASEGDFGNWYYSAASGCQLDTGVFALQPSSEPEAESALKARLFRIGDNAELVRGTVGCETNNYGTIFDGIFQGKVANFRTISNGTFQREVNNYRTISGGTFQADVDNNGNISGGTFQRVVFNNDTISGGSFLGDMNNWGTISGGIFLGGTTTKPSPAAPSKGWWATPAPSPAVPSKRMCTTTAPSPTVPSKGRWSTTKPSPAAPLRKLLRYTPLPAMRPRSRAEPLKRV